MDRPVAIRKTLGAPQEDGSPRLPAFPLQVFPRPWREWVSDAAQWAGSASSLLSETYLPGTRLVRAFSATDASAIQGRSGRQTDKVAIPIAGNDPAAVQTAVQLVRDAGCDPLVVGNLAAARSFQQGGPGFRANATLPDLRRRLGLPDGG